MTTSSSEGRALELTQRGLDLVREGRTREAIAIAHELHEMRFTGGFEVEAQALAREGSMDAAISVLRNGLEKAPAAWLNANLLGNYLSDVGRYEEAFAVYEEASRTPAADLVLLESNHAMALQRAGQDEAAREKLRTVLDRDLSQSEPELRSFIQSLAEELGVPSR